MPIPRPDPPTPPRHRLVKQRCVAALVLGLCAGSATARAPQDPPSGLWPWSHLPEAALEALVGSPGRGWADSVQQAAVRLDREFSGVFVSDSGLLLTCYHSVAQHLERLPEGPAVDAGGWLAARGEELPVPGLSAEVLVATLDITDRMAAAGDPRAEEAAASKELLASLPAPSASRRARLVSRWGGAVQVLHVLDRYDDVRVVWVPPSQLAQFGGRRDNFTYPRYSMDAALLRVFDGGKPLRPAQHLEIRVDGPRRGEPVVVLGHPGRTDRWDTAAELKSYRDLLLPRVIDSLVRQLAALERLPGMDPLADARIQSEQFRLANSIRALEGELSYLNSPGALDVRGMEEHRLAAGDPDVAEALDGILRVREATGRHYPTLWHAAVPGSLFRRARSVARALERSVEDRVATADRLRRDEPLIAAMEQAILEAAFEAARADLGDEHRLTVALLDGQASEARSRALVRDTALLDAGGVARALVDDPQALARDPVVRLARAMDAIRHEEHETFLPLRREERSHRRLVDVARFRAAPHAHAPDADGTLRLSMGRIRGLEVGNQLLPARTTLGGLFARRDAFDGTRPFDLPGAVLERRSNIDPTTPLCFACSTDVAAGFSGAPVLDADRQVLGIVFDGNEATLGSRFAAPGADGRSVAVSTAAILEWLRVTPGGEAVRLELMSRR